MKAFGRRRLWLTPHVKETCVRFCVVRCMTFGCLPTCTKAIVPFFECFASWTGPVDEVWVQDNSPSRNCEMQFCSLAFSAPAAASRRKDVTSSARIVTRQLQLLPYR